jgi:hypothetical protein
VTKIGKHSGRQIHRLGLRRLRPIADGGRGALRDEREPLAGLSAAGLVLFLPVAGRDFGIGRVTRREGAGERALRKRAADEQHQKQRAM